jgi:hypothetical protein
MGGIQSLWTFYVKINSSHATSGLLTRSTLLSISPETTSAPRPSYKKIFRRWLFEDLLLYERNIQDIYRQFETGKAGWLVLGRESGRRPPKEREVSSMISPLVGDQLLSFHRDITANFDPAIQTPHPTLHSRRWTIMGIQAQMSKTFSGVAGLMHLVKLRARVLAFP